MQKALEEEWVEALCHVTPLLGLRRRARAAARCWMGHLLHVGQCRDALDWRGGHPAEVPAFIGMQGAAQVGGDPGARA